MKKIKSIIVDVKEDLQIKYDKNSFLPNKTTFKKKGDNIIMTEHIELKGGDLFPIDSIIPIKDIKIERG